ncbi:unnamed protein product [Protopolystoma xenopodis]|uniref:Uncharacterized protein n=1 Tax=Protopolystoma xenopodis TaxID=117903 RepID=A0A3S5APC7_9PLAT|nr:unnamed protein product [Protopolystoma xenopodis]
MYPGDASSSSDLAGFHFLTEIEANAEAESNCFLPGPSTSQKTQSGRSTGFLQHTQRQLYHFGEIQKKSSFTSQPHLAPRVATETPTTGSSKATRQPPHAHTFSHAATENAIDLPRQPEVTDTVGLSKCAGPGSGSGPGAVAWSAPPEGDKTCLHPTRVAERGQSLPSKPSPVTKPKRSTDPDNSESHSPAPRPTKQLPLEPLFHHHHHRIPQFQHHAHHHHHHHHHHHEHQNQSQMTLGVSKDHQSASRKCGCSDRIAREKSY